MSIYFKKERYCTRKNIFRMKTNEVKTLIKENEV